MAAVCASMIAVPAAAVKVQASKAGLRTMAAPSAATFSQKTVGNGIKTSQMLVWTPINNKFFETFSYLPPLDAAQISKQVDYIVNNSYIPSLEFAMPEGAYIGNESTIRFGGSAACNYYDNRYWTMYKLPMFGCTDPSQVLKEIENCTKSFPDAYIRLVAFDQVRQVQCAGFLVHRPANSTEYTETTKRSV